MNKIMHNGKIRQMTEAELKAAAEYREKHAGLSAAVEPGMMDKLLELEKKLQKLMEIFEKWGLKLDD